MDKTKTSQPMNQWNRQLSTIDCAECQSFTYTTEQDVGKEEAVSIVESLRKKVNCSVYKKVLFKGDVNIRNGWTTFYVTFTN